MPYLRIGGSWFVQVGDEVVLVRRVFASSKIDTSRVGQAIFTFHGSN
jgi:hypothetical protein